MQFTTTMKSLAAAVAAACSLAGAAHAADTTEIKLGFAAPLTGPQAHYGEDMKNGLTLAIEEANKKGIKIDGETAKFVLVARDDQADPKTGVTVAQQLVDEEVQGILGHFNSGTTIPASQVYSDAGLPQIAMATAAEYTQQGYENAFRMMTSDTQQGTAVGRFIVEDLKAKKVAIIDDRTAYGQGLADKVAEAVKKAGGEVVAREYTTDKASDFNAILTNIKADKPDAVFFGGLDAQSGPMKKQFNTQGLNVPFVSGEMTRSETFLKLAGNAAEGTYASLAGVPLASMEAGKAFEQAYKARFHTEPGVYAPYAYDGAWNMITAMQKADSTDPDKVIAALRQLDRSGATSKHISYDDEGNLKEISVTLYQVKDGEWQTYKSMVSQAQQ